LLLTLQKCFKAFNLENDTARQRTPHGPAPGRGPVVADHCCRKSLGTVGFAFEGHSLIVTVPY